MRIVIAPDSFKGTIGSTDAARAIAAGWRRGDPAADVVELPIADGGEGTLDVLVAALGGARRSVPATGPLGDPVEADIGLVETPVGPTAIVEMARASGLGLVAAERRDPLRATTFGTGELILEAARSRPARIILCIGGSATTDGGAGMAQALGVRLLDAAGGDIPPGGGALRRLERIEVRGLAPELRGVDVVVATDVDNPLLGPDGAAPVYGPQKGADPAQVAVLERGLRRMAAVIRRDLGLDVDQVPGAGAAGGLGAGAVAFLGARLRSGFEVVAEALDLAGALRDADVAVTGEGTFDAQTARGKGPHGVLRMAREAGCRTVVIAGQVDRPDSDGADQVLSLADLAGTVTGAMERAGALLERAAEDAARRIAAG